MYYTTSSKAWSITTPAQQEHLISALEQRSTHLNPIHSILPINFKRELIFFFRVTFRPYFKFGQLGLLPTLKRGKTLP